MRRTIQTTAKKYHVGGTMVLHATSSKDPGEHRSGAVFKERQGYAVVFQGSVLQPSVVVHTYAWAKRLLWKHLKGGRW